LVLISIPFTECAAVPIEYFCSLDENGRRRDADERPELSCGSVEFVAQTEYMVRPPMPPVYFFLIDVSISAVKSGMLKVSISHSLESLLNSFN
jgi:protein transport protein SEC24